MQKLNADVITRDFPVEHNFFFLFEVGMQLHFILEWSITCYITQVCSILKQTNLVYFLLADDDDRSKLEFFFKTLKH